MLVLLLLVLRLVMMMMVMMLLLMLNYIRARFTIAHQHRYVNLLRWTTTSHRSRRRPRYQRPLPVVPHNRGVRVFLRLGPFRFVAMVLEPNLHLRRRQVDHAGQMLALRCGQVAGLLEAPFQLERLCFRKQDAPFALLVATGTRQSTSGIVCLLATATIGATKRRTRA